MCRGLLCHVQKGLNFLVLFGMFVYVQFVGRRGNQMFQYWVGAYIADQLGWPLHVFSGDYRKIYFPLRPTDIVQQHHIDSTHGWAQPEHGQFYLDIPRAIVEHKASGKPLYINKQLESYALMRPYLDYVRALYHRPIDAADRIVVHMRLGDLENVNGPLNEAYTRFACDVATRHPTKPVLIVSERCDTEWTRHMQAALQATHSVTVKPTHQDSYQEDNDCILASTVIVATNSTFSWWAAMLSEHATEVNIFLHKDQFAASLREELIYEGLPPHWHCLSYK